MREWGEHLKFLRAIHRKTGHEPSALKSEPELSVNAAFAYNGFLDISRRRSYSSNGPNPLNTCEMRAWLDEQAIRSALDRAMFMRIWDQLDHEWLK